MPTAETVINQYIEATGGKAAYEKLKNRVVTGTIEIPAANIKGNTKMMQALPNKFADGRRARPRWPRSGGVSDGTNAWESIDEWAVTASSTAMRKRRSFARQTF